MQFKIVPLNIQFVFRRTVPFPAIQVYLLRTTQLILVRGVRADYHTTNVLIVQRIVKVLRDHRATAQDIVAEKRLETHVRLSKVLRSTQRIRSRHPLSRSCTAPSVASRVNAPVAETVRGSAGRGSQSLLQLTRYRRCRSQSTLITTAAVATPPHSHDYRGQARVHLREIRRRRVDIQH